MDYRKEVEERKKKIEEIEAELEEIKSQWAKTCPVVIKDAITLTDENSYTYIGKKMEVRQISIQRRWKDWGFKLRGPLLKKDGTPGENWGECFLNLEGEGER